MGVAFSHCKASWAYSGFGHFRRNLWTLAGFKGDLYKLYKDKGQMIADGHPLFPLFNHSDCDGVLTPDELKGIVPALEILLPKLDDGYDRQMGTELLQGMKLAIEENKNLEFR